MKYQPPVGGAPGDPYVDVNETGGVDGSIVPAKAIEHHLRELVHLINASGQTPDESDLTQVRQAVQFFAAAASAVEPGRLSATARSTAPAGWLICDGSAKSRTGPTAALFDAIGTTFGAGDGSTTFNIPEGRNRAMIGAGEGPGLTPRELGQTGGAETHVLTIDEMPSHNHATPGRNAAGAGGVAELAPGPETSEIGTTFAGGGQAHNNMPPWFVGNWIIKT